MEDNQRLMCIPKRIDSMVIKVFQVYSDSIVDILADSTFGKYEILMQDLEMDIPFGGDLWEFFKRNKRIFKIFTLRYLAIQDLGGDVNKAVLLQNNQFIKYINGLRKRKIGVVLDENVLDSSDKTYWGRQILFKDIIEENILKYYQTKNGNYRYFIIGDVIDLFTGKTKSQSISGTELYEQFLNENGRYDFKLSCDSIGKYLNCAGRFFTKQRIHIKDRDRRMNIYTLVNQ